MGFTDVESSRYDRLFAARGNIFDSRCLSILPCQWPCYHPAKVPLSMARENRRDYPRISGLNRTFERVAVRLLMYTFPMLSIYKILSLVLHFLNSFYHQHSCISTLHIYRCQKSLCYSASAADVKEELQASNIPAPLLGQVERNPARYLLGRRQGTLAYKADATGSLAASDV